MCILYANRRVQIWNNMQIPSSVTSIVYTGPIPSVCWIIYKHCSNSASIVPQSLGLVITEISLFVLSWSLGIYPNFYPFFTSFYASMEFLFCKSNSLVIFSFSKAEGVILCISIYSFNSVLRKFVSLIKMLLQISL